MKALKDFGCGAVVGVANIIPGVSGGTMAVVLGVYAQLLEAMGLKNLKKNIPFLIPFGMGCVAGILAFSRAIEFLLENFPMATNFTFIGLILGSIPMIWKNAKEQSRSHSGGMTANYIAMLVMFAAMMLLNSATGGNPDVITEVDLSTAIWLAAVGAISSFAMILPGVSGSFVMLLLGAYPTVLAAISRFDFAVLIPAGCGIVLGILLGSRLVSFLLEKIPSITYFGIMGLILGSLFGIFPGFVLNIEGMIALVLMVGAAMFTMWFSRKG